MKQMTGHVSIYYTNLGKYNEGELVGEWITLPFTKEELAAVNQRIGIDGDEYEEYFCTDYETTGSYFYFKHVTGEYMNIQTLSNAVEFYNNLCENDTAVFNSLLENGCNIDDILSGKIDIDNYIVRYGTVEELAEEDLINCIGQDAFDTVENYIDLKTYGEEQLLDATCVDDCVGDECWVYES